MRSLERHTVLPGQLLVSGTPALISTVLGSCVSVCLWDKELKIGGLNHYLLPGDTDDELHNSNRGLSATRLLIRMLLKRNARIADIEAKVFGGCNSLYQQKDLYRVGERNVEIALRVLSESHIPVKACHTGGAFGRKIVFNTLTGKVRMRLLDKPAILMNEEVNKGFGY